MTKGLRDLFWSFTSSLGNAVVILAVQVVLARYLEPEGRGAYAVCLAFALVIGVAVEVGTDTASAYMVASRRLSLSQGLSNAIVLSLGTGLMGMAFGWLALKAPLAYFSRAEPAAFQLSLLLIPLHLLYRSLIRVLTGIKRFFAYTTFTLANSLTLLIAAGVFIPFLGLGVYGAIWAQAISWLIAAGGLLVYYHRSAGYRWSWPERRSTALLVNYGVRDYFGKIANLANVQLGTIFLAFFVGAQEIGWFAVAFSAVSRIGFIPDSLGMVLLPRVAEDGLTGRAETIARSARISFLLSVLVLIPIVVWAEPLVRFFLSPAFLPAVPIIRLLAIGFAVRSGCKLFMPYLAGTNRPGLVSFAVLASVLVNGVFLWLLLPRIGVHGAVWAAIAGYCVSSALLLGWFCRFSKMNLRDVLRFRLSDWSPLFSIFSRLEPVG